MKKIMLFIGVLVSSIFCEDTKENDQSSKFVGFFSPETENKLISLFEKFLEKQEKQIEKEQILKNMKTLVNLSKDLDDSYGTPIKEVRKKFYLLLEKI